MEVVVLGATGRTGRLVVEQALARGDEVVAYVRNSQGIAAKTGLSVVVGQLGDLVALKAAINGTDAVLVCLGTRGKRMKRMVDHSRLSRVSDFRVAATSSSHVWAFTDPPKPGRLRRLSGIGIGRRKT
jgi:uncharacterized protein YbjT (DUF2867 family)